MTARKPSAGSRYLYEPFDFASRAEVRAQERVTEVQIAALEGHVGRIEAMVERIERRLWAALAGIVAVAAAEVIRAVIALGA